MNGVWLVVSAIEQMHDDDEQTSTFNVVGTFTTAVRGYVALVECVTGRCRVSSREGDNLYVRAVDSGHLYSIRWSVLDQC